MTWSLPRKSITQARRPPGWQLVLAVLWEPCAVWSLGVHTTQAVGDMHSMLYYHCICSSCKAHLISHLSVILAWSADDHMHV